MTDLDREAIRSLISRIEAQGKSLYYIAKLMRRQVVQVQRMKKSGRCQPHELAQLREILEDVSRETLQNVTNPIGHAPEIPA